MKLVAKPHHLHTIERERGAQPQWVPNVPNVSSDVGRESATKAL